MLDTYAKCGGIMVSPCNEYVNERNATYTRVRSQLVVPQGPIRLVNNKHKENMVTEKW